MKANRLTQFCQYLVSGGVASPALLKNKKAVKSVGEIIDNADDDEVRNSPSKSVQAILAEYEEWVELYPEMEVVCWPDSQALMGRNGFHSHSRLINGEEGLTKYGSSAYLVESKWLNDTTTRYPQDPAGVLVIAYDEELKELGLL